MNTVLITADNIKASREVLSSMSNVVTTPKNIVLLHVQQLVGNATMTAMMSDSEIETLKESIEGSEHKERLDRKAETVLAHYRKELERRGLTNIKTITKAGHPPDEIIKVAEEEKVDLIIVGCSGKSRLKRFATGCASRDVEKNATVRVLITKNNGCGKHAHLWNGKEAYAL
ncbi:MAG: universal stress protein [Nitrospiraceae bacterium]|nr:MAG: universal stress protein [Nitrospiraceae bacterium]UCH44739.1 MAG: universal stress protein [Nitrospiraceae bacterium]